MADAPAVIAGQGFSQLFLGRFRVFHEKRLGAHNNSRRAVTALERGIICKGSLQRTQLSGNRIRQTFQGNNTLSITIRSQQHTGGCRVSVHNDRAAAAGSVIAASFDGSQVQAVPQFRIHKGIVK